MNTQTVDNKESSIKWIAHQDAKMRSYAASSHYLTAEKLIAERIRYCLESCYYTSGIYLIFRKKFITIKIDKARIRNAKDLANLEQDYKSRGITKVISAQGVIYRIPKQ